ncbi:hypothetical protein AB0323_00350 [Arthrobacter sp. NPDC080031]|uniref:SLAC1 family transporter n=1 Tax=Arthrobacter sp. NPDC080031 TaxID=3155918 RepID=UPI00344BE8E9
MTRSSITASPIPVDNPTEAGARHRRLTYSLMSVPLGLAGSGAAWTAAARQFDITPLIGEALFLGSLLGWLAITIARIPISRSRWHELRSDLRNPATGPFPAYVPIVGLLLTGHYSSHLPQTVSQVLCMFWVSLLCLISGHLIAIWFGGTLRLDHLHPGYSLPVIAGPFIASTVLSVVGFHEVALTAIGAGAFFWLVIGTIIIGRLIVAEPLPSYMAPTLSVIVTPPVTGGLAWFAYSGGQVDGVQFALVGVIFLLVLTQVFFVPTYRNAPYSIVWWAFSFPAGALAGYSIRWEAAIHTLLSGVIAMCALGVSSGTLLALSGASILSFIRARRATRGSTATHG